MNKQKLSKLFQEDKLIEVAQYLKSFPKKKNTAVILQSRLDALKAKPNTSANDLLFERNQIRKSLVDLINEDSKIHYSYHYEFSNWFWIIVSGMLFIIIGMAYFASDYKDLSPFISSPQELINDYAEWKKRDCLDSLELKPWYFHLDNLFALGLCFLSGFCFYAFYNKKQLDSETHEPVPSIHPNYPNLKILPAHITNHFTFSWNNSFKQIWKTIKNPSTGFIHGFLIISLFSSLLFDLIENFCFLNNLDAFHNAPYVNLLLIKSFKLVAYGFTLGAILYQILYGYLNDRFPLASNLGAFISEKFRYLIRSFYPSLLGIIVLIYILNTFNVFDALLISIFNWFNFLFFIALFAGMLLTVWFIPYYLRFTKTFYNNLSRRKNNLVAEYLENEIKQQPSGRSNQNHKAKLVKELTTNEYIGRYFYNSIQKNLFLPIDKLEETDPTVPIAKTATRAAANRSIISKVIPLPEQKEQDYSPGQTTIINHLFDSEKDTTLSAFFHKTRRLIAYLFIMSLLYQEGQLLDNLLNTSYIKFGLVGLSLLLMFAYLDSYQSSFHKTEDKIVNLWHLKLYRGIIRVNLISLIILFILVCIKLPWIYLLLGLIWNTFLLPFSFMGFALYRRVTKNYEFVIKEGDKNYNEIYKDWGIKSLYSYMPLFLGGSIVLLGSCILVSSCANINAFESLNPLNLFLIFFNGFIAIIAVIDRFIVLKKEQKALNLSAPNASGNYPVRNKRITNATIAILYLGLLLIFHPKENHYHDISYTKHKVHQWSAENKILNFEEYTDSYLNNRADTTPIIMVAADGGGLRAAYWTMLVMNELDEASNEQFSNQLFLNTGISGGGIGLGMYTFQKAQGFPLSERKRLADKIGTTNFLSGDLAGLAGKELITHLLPNFLNFSDWEDRAAAMARNYFQLQGVKDFKKFNALPFHHLWTTKKDSLPLLVVNTARAEDGSRGIVHPLTYNRDTTVNSFVDLSANYREQLISYPDAVFLTNRFPLFSPSARIEGKGHFVDGGYLENSGLSTIFNYLHKLSSPKNEKQRGIYKKLKRRKIIVINISNDKESYIQNYFDEFKNKVNKSVPQSEVGSIIGATASTGTSALPKYYKEIFDTPTFSDLFELNQFQFIQIKLPYLIHTDEVHNAFYGQIADCSIPSIVNTHNKDLCKSFKPDKQNPTLFGASPINAPPLGRIMSDNTVKYMKDMLDHQSVKSEIEKVKEQLEK